MQAFSLSPSLYGVSAMQLPWTAQGFTTHRSGLCAKLWLALAFLVESGRLQAHRPLSYVATACSQA